MPPPPVLEYASPRRGFNPLRFFATGPDRPVLQDPAEVDRLYRRCRWSIMLTISLGYGFMYTSRLGFNVAKSKLIDGNIFTVDELGRIGSGLFYGYAFGRLVNGILADHANLKRFFAAGVLLTAVVNLVMGCTTHFWLWTVLWGMNGWFQGFGAPSSIVSIARWFGSKERGRVYGSWSVAHSLGEGLTFVATAYIVSLWGWQAGFLGPGVFCLLVAVGVYVFMYDRPQTLGLPPIAHWQSRVSPGPAGPCCPRCGSRLTGPRENCCLTCDINIDPERLEACQEDPSAISKPKVTGWAQLEILKLPALWIICLASATMYMTRYAVISWGMFYLEKERGYSLLESGVLIGLNTAAGLAGCVAYGFISDLLFGARRPPVTLLFGILEVLSLFVMFYLPPGHPYILAAAFIVYGFTLSGLLAVLGGLFAVDIVPKTAAGAAIGLTGVFSYAAAGLQDRVTGYLLAKGETIVNGTPHYDFRNAILFWIGASVVSLLLASSLWRVKMRE